MSVAQAQRSMDALEFARWRVLRRIRHDPDDIRIADLRATISRCHGGKAKRADYLPRLKGSGQSISEIRARLKAFGVMQEAREKAVEAKKEARRQAIEKRKARRGN